MPERFHLSCSPWTTIDTSIQNAYHINLLFYLPNPDPLLLCIYIYMGLMLLRRFLEKLLSRCLHGQITITHLLLSGMTALMQLFCKTPLRLIQPDLCMSGQSALSPFISLHLSLSLSLSWPEEGKKFSLFASLRLSLNCFSLSLPEEEKKERPSLIWYVFLLFPTKHWSQLSPFFPSLLTYLRLVASKKCEGQLSHLSQKA